MTYNRRLLHEFEILWPTMINAKPELGQASPRGLLKKFIIKHGSPEQALAELIRLNKTESVHTEFCSDCEAKITEKEEKFSQLVREKQLCNDHTVCPVST